MLRCAKSPRFDVLAKYASARRFFARLASEIFLTSLQTEFFGNLLGKIAKDIPERLNGIRTARDASIYFHGHKCFQQRYYLTPEPPDAFGYWATNVLKESRLGECLSSIDIIQFARISNLTIRSIEIFDGYLQTACRSGDVPAEQEVF